MSRLQNIDELVDKLKALADLRNVMACHGVQFTADTSSRLSKALCFLHEEKDPSLIVDNEKQIYKCFGGGCEAKGDVITFLRQMYGVTFNEAVEMLASDLSFDLKAYIKPLSAEEKEQARLIKINDEAASFFHMFLMGNKKSLPKLKYLKSRDVSTESIKKFRLGYVDNVGRLVEFLKMKGISQTDIEALELDREDLFNNRIVYPICDAYGRVISFFTRGEGAGQKYIGTSSKSKTYTNKKMYNFHNAKKFQKVYMVEGFHDVITLDQNGVTNVCAFMGSALTTSQTELCKEHGIEELVICFDGDLGGQNALEAFLKKPVDIRTRVVSLPQDGKDPDDFVRAYGIEQFKLQLDGAISIFEFWINKLMDGKSNLSLTKKLELMRELYDKLQHVSPYEREIVINELSQRFDLSKESANDFIDRLNTKNVNLINVEAEKAILSALLNGHDKTIDVITTIPLEAFSVNKYFVLYKLIKEIVLSNNTISTNLILSTAKSKGIVEIDRKLLDSLSTIDHSNIAFYIGELVDKYMRRMIQDTLNKGLNQVLDVKRTSVDVSENLIRNIASITSHVSNDNPTPREQVASTIKELDRRSKVKGGIIGLDIGRKFPRLNNLLQGLQEGHMVSIAGLPKVGKSAFAHNIALDLAFYNKIPVLWVNLEMSAQDLAFRGFSILTGIDNSRLKVSSVNNKEKERLAEVMHQYSECPFFIGGGAGLTTSQIVSVCRKYIHREGVKLVVIDYVQRIRADKDFARDSRWEQLGVISETIQNKIAMDMKTNVLLLAQLQRKAAEAERAGVDGASGEFIGGAFKIIQDVDAFIALKRDKEAKDIINLHVDENRHGESDVYINMRFDRGSLRMEETD